VHRDEPPPWIFDDYLALPLAGAAGELLKAGLSDKMALPDLLAFSRWTCARARFTEDIVEQKAASGVDQFVILGAGLDTFAYRRGDLSARLHVFEVDHPATQSWKRHRLSNLGVAIPENLVFAAADFERETLRDALERAGFDFGRRAVFSWIGVTLYLSREAIDAVLSTVAQGTGGTCIVSTYNQPVDVLDRRDAEITTAVRKLATSWGEPYVSLFRSEEIDAVLRSHGFADVVHFGREEAQTRYAAAGQLEIAGAQRVTTASLAAAAV
jgi:methyltransferase (TIGR00027 family)